MGVALPPPHRNGQPYIVLAVPSGSFWHAQFAMSLMFLMNQMVARGISSSVSNPRGSILPNLRHTAVQFALDNGATHVLFLDSDQTFPKETTEILLSHGKDVVAANIATKQFPSTPTARLRGDEVSGDPLYTTPKSQPRLQRVWRVGTGVMLIKTSVFRRVGPPPWFEVPWVEELGTYRGEDWFFCERLEKAGIPLFVDHALSLQVGHIGDCEYTHEMVPAPREVVNG
jgi:hypothetical protein